MPTPDPDRHPWMAWASGLLGATLVAAVGLVLVATVLAVGYRLVAWLVGW